MLRPADPCHPAASDYVLSIDGSQVGTFSTDELGSGVNVAAVVTPMTEQALAVHHKTIDHTQGHKHRWRNIQMHFQPAPTESVRSTVEGLNGLKRTIVAEQHALAQPKPHQFRRLGRDPAYDCGVKLRVTPSRLLGRDLADDTDT